MGLWSLSVAFGVFLFLGVSEASYVYFYRDHEYTSLEELPEKIRYAVIFPSEFSAQHPETLCVQVDGAEGESKVRISITLNDKEITLINKTFQEENIFSCLEIQVPIPEVNEAVGALTLLIENSGELIHKTNKVLVKKPVSKILVQTDKAVYKAGQTVRVRILSLNEELKPENSLIPVVEVQDPSSNRIHHWLNVSFIQGISELFFALSSESTLGKYSIKLKDVSHTFTVEEYVLPKFEVTIQFPKYLIYNSEQFQVTVCGKYTYGKPVQGDFRADIYSEPISWISDSYSIFSHFSGKLDISGCHIIEINFDDFDLNNIQLPKQLRVEAFITEEGTGLEQSSINEANITYYTKKAYFINAENNYKPGIPYKGLIKVEDASGVPQPNTTVYLKCRFDSMCQTLVTDENGQASFTIDTNGLYGALELRVTTDLSIQPYLYNIPETHYGQDLKYVARFFFPGKSSLKVHSLDKVVTCDGLQEVHVEYIISHTELKEAKTLSLHYLLVSRNSIKHSGTVEIKTESTNTAAHGNVTLNIPLRPDTSKFFHVLVYILMPNEVLLADTARFNVLECLKNKVSTRFSPGEVLPGSDVFLQVEAAPGSLCGLQVVDNSVLLMKPEKELTADKVFGLFPTDFQEYDNRVLDNDNSCDDKDYVDVYSLFMAMRLKVLTSASIKKSAVCPYYFIESFAESQAQKGNEKAKPKVRSYFPETWIWELVALGESGRVEIHHKAPDTITDWNAGAICMGPSGFGMSPPSSLRVFQPLFVDLTLPYSVVRGETFTLKASVFNYLKECIKVLTTLQTTEEFEEQPCDHCHYSSCICADESKTFYWNLKATKLGQVNITVTAEAVDTKEFCGNEIAVVPKQDSTDTIVKSVLVQPGGILEEKSHSSLICIEEEGQLKVEEISLKIPENILEDSARAHVTVLGDLMGTAMQNLDHLLAMPYGCGEQNMVLFAPNIFILEYLEETHQLNSEIQSKAEEFLESGYQRQLTYKRDDGSYSAFGKIDREGNTWLTGFVVKSFSKARPYIFIDESLLNHSFSWLEQNQLDTGCFLSVGQLFNNAMKGGVEDEISLSAYITIALLEAGVSLQDPLLNKAILCLRRTSVDVSNVYTQSLLAYAFTLSGDIELRKMLLDKLEKKAVKGDGQLHWKRDVPPPSEDSYWYRAPSAEVELTSYVLLALLSGPNPDIGKASMIVNWLSKQQNPYGGFSSTQDTVVALQALAKYAELTFSDKGDITVEVTSKSGFHEQFHVDTNNRLLLQRASLSKIPEDYTVTATGAGCVFVQAVLRYNVPPPKTEATFLLSVKSFSRTKCLEDSMSNFEILITAVYIGTREKSNMAIIEVKMLSGYIPVKNTLTVGHFIQRSDIQNDLVTLYLEQIDHNPVSFYFMVEQDVVVKDLKPATVKVYDYYETDEQTAAEYFHPCSPDISKNS